MVVMPHTSSQPSGAPVWQTRHPGQMYSSGEYAAGSPGQTFGGSNLGHAYSSAGGGEQLNQTDFNKT
ncbi:hypothetical protein Tco_1323922 [Tanacetum coccineum]